MKRLQIAIEKALLDALDHIDSDNLRDYVVEEVLMTYCRYFERAVDTGVEEEPPTSNEPDRDALLLAVWDVLVDREMEETDAKQLIEHGGEYPTLEDFYADAFAGMLRASELATELPTREELDERLRVFQEREGVTLLTSRQAEVPEPARQIVTSLEKGDMYAAVQRAESVIDDFPHFILARYLLIETAESAEAARAMAEPWGSPPQLRLAFPNWEDGITLPDYLLFQQAAIRLDFWMGRNSEGMRRFERSLDLGLPEQVLRKSTGMIFSLHAQREMGAGRLLPASWQPPVKPMNATPRAASIVLEEWTAFTEGLEAEMLGLEPSINGEMLDIPRGGYQLKVTLKGTRPPIWRRIVVPANIPLGDLHEVLQRTMGWQNYHLHAFRSAMDVYGPPGESEYMESYGGMGLNILMQQAGDRIDYEYDFGDDWTHEIKLEKVLQEAPQRITCLKGMRACPPEDCGGVYGYQALVDAINGKPSELGDDLLEWTGGPFDPEAFSVEEVNRRLGAIGGKY